MAFIPVPGTAKVEILFTYQGQPGANVLHFTEAAAPTASSMLALASTVKTEYAAHILNSKVPTWTLDAVRATDLTTFDGPQAIVLAGTAGGGSGEGATPERALVVKLLTDSRSRSARGRVFDSGYTEASFNADGSVPSLTGTNIVGFWEAFRTALVADDTNLVVASLFSGGAPRSIGLTHPVVNFGWNPIVGVQRRRIHR